MGFGRNHQQRKNSGVGVGAIRRLLLTTLFVVPALSAPGIDGASLIRFNDHYELLFREFMGCPKDATDIGQCASGQGVLNVRELRQSCEAAKQLFGLQGQCGK